MSCVLKVLTCERVLAAERGCVMMRACMDLVEWSRLWQHAPVHPPSYICGAA